MPGAGALAALALGLLASAACGQAPPEGASDVPAPAPPMLDAVARLDVDGRAACTAVLIAPDLALTAGHCAAGFAPGAERAPTRLTLLFDLRDGRAAAIRGVRAVTLHPAHEPGARTGASLRHDLALLALARPVAPEEARPLAVGGIPPAGAEVAVAGYPRARPERAEVAACAVLGSDRDVLGTACPAESGQSGAPVLLAPAGGGASPRVVAVLAARMGREGSLGPLLGAPLAELLAAAEVLEDEVR